MPASIAESSEEADEGEIEESAVPHVLWGLQGSQYVYCSVSNASGMDALDEAFDIPANPSISASNSSNGTNRQQGIAIDIYLGIFYEKTVVDNYLVCVKLAGSWPTQGKFFVKHFQPGSTEPASSSPPAGQHCCRACRHIPATPSVPRRLDVWQ